MASTLHQDTRSKQQHDRDETVVASVEETELVEAQKDPRVRSFLAEADAYLAEFEQRGRNH